MIVIFVVIAVLQSKAENLVANSTWIMITDEITESFTFIGENKALYLNSRYQSVALSYSQKGNNLEVTFSNGMAYSGEVIADELTLKSKSNGRTTHYKKQVHSRKKNNTAFNASKLVEVVDPFTKGKATICSVLPNEQLGEYEFMHYMGLVPAHRIVLNSDGTGYSLKQVVDEAKSTGYETKYKYDESKKEAIKWGLLSENDKIVNVSAIVDGSYEGNPSMFKNYVSITTPLLFIEYENKDVSCLYFAKRNGKLELTLPRSNALVKK